MSQANGKRHRVLLVTPVEQGSGETITSLHVAQGLVSRGHEVRFLAAPFAARFLEPHFPDRIDRLGFDERENRRDWAFIYRHTGYDPVASGQPVPGTRSIRARARGGVCAPSTS